MKKNKIQKPKPKQKPKKKQPAAPLRFATSHGKAEMHRALSAHLRALFGPNQAALYGVDESLDFVPEWTSGKKTGVFEKCLQTLVDQGLFAEALKHSSPAWVRLKLPGVSMSCLLPLKQGSDILGMLCIYLKTPLQPKRPLLKKMGALSQSLSDWKMREQRREHLKEREHWSLFKTAIHDQSSEGMFLLDKAFTILETNAAGARLTGLEERTLLGRTFTGLLTPASEFAWVKTTQKLFKEGSVRRADLEILHKTGESTPVSFSASYLENHSGSDKGRVVALVSDLSNMRGLIQTLEESRQNVEEQNLALEEKIRERTRELQEKIQEFQTLSNFNATLMNNVQAGLVALDEDFRVTLFNQAASRILGVEEREIMGQTLLKFPTLSKLEVLTRQALEEKKTIAGIEMLLTHPLNPGQEIMVSVTATPLHASLKESRGVMLFFADVTRLRVMHRKMLQSERLSALGQMAAGVAHEIRNPMNVIRGLTEIMGRKNLPEEKAKQYRDTIMSQIDRLELLLKEMVDYIKQREPDLEVQNLATRVRESLELYQEGFLSRCGKNISLDFKQQGTPPAIPFDKDQLQQILFNLLKNSVESIGENGHIGVTLEEEGDFVVLSVQDDGCGMDESVRERALDAFFTTKMAKGTGLGLAIVKSIMDLHHGSVEVKSKLKSGTTIVLKFSKEVKIS